MMDCEGCSKLFWEIMMWFLIVSSAGCAICVLAACRLSSIISREEEEAQRQLMDLNRHIRPMSHDDVNGRSGPES